MKRILFLFLALGVMLSACAPAEPDAAVNITGTILNLSDAGQYLYEDSFLQLVRISNEGGGSIVFPADGKIYIDSDLAQTPLPTDDVFHFSMDSIEPGKYFVSVQKFNPPNAMNFNAMVLATDPNDPASIVVFEVPESASLSFNYNMGEVSVVLP